MQKWETSFTGQKLHIPKWLKSNPGVRQVPFTGAQAPSSFIALLWTEWCPLEFLWWSPNLPAPHPSVTIGGVKKWLRLNEITWVGPWSHRSSVPIRGNTRELKTSVTMNLSLSTTLGHSENWPSESQDEGLSHKLNPTWDLILYLQPQESWEIHFCCLSHPLCGIDIFLWQLSKLRHPLTLSEELCSQAFWFRPWHSPLCMLCSNSL